MSETQPHAERQKQRWVEYGANVALVIIVAIALTFFVVAIAQRASRQWDTTSARIYSLKPQTANVIRDLKQKVRIVSLYSTQTKPDARTDPEGRFTAQEWPTYVQGVADLLQEYKRNSSNIEVELIDPASSPAKVDGLINDVTNRYGGCDETGQGLLKFAGGEVASLIVLTLTLVLWIAAPIVATHFLIRRQDI